MNAHTPEIIATPETVIANALRMSMPSAAGCEHVIAGIVVSMLRSEGWSIYPVLKKKPKVTTFTREQVAEALRCEVIVGIEAVEKAFLVRTPDAPDGKQFKQVRLSDVLTSAGDGLPPGPPEGTQVGPKDPPWTPPAAVA